LIILAPNIARLQLERIRVTEDGSHSLFNEVFNQHYHSTSGALMESMHIYMNLGLIPLLEASVAPIYVFEMGFGTGLNAYLTWHFAEKYKKEVIYTGVEAMPVSVAEASQLNYREMIAGEEDFMQLHTSPWENKLQLSPYFSFRKAHTRIQDFAFEDSVDVIYYDAFDPKAQPELWTEEILKKVASHTKKGGVLVTYSSKGIVKRALASAGFLVERHKGPGKKFHVVMATLQ
jgi:tRNA U34 5-methylaminomethyl-2-thiouridine-forming methyltransferase MnmC